MGVFILMPYQSLLTQIIPFPHPVHAAVEWMTEQTSLKIWWFWYWPRETFSHFSLKHSFRLVDVHCQPRHFLKTHKIIFLFKGSMTHSWHCKHSYLIPIKPLIYAVKAQTSLAPLSRFRGSRVTTTHAHQCCRFQSYAKNVPSRMKLTMKLTKRAPTFLGSTTTDHVIMACDLWL